MSCTRSLVVIGGSNSLLREGWVDKLKWLHPDPDRVLNLSIGAATTAMGLYRLLTCKALPPNPVILWEYSLNEFNYFANRQSARVLLYHTRWLLEICARRGYPVLPVLLYNKDEVTGKQSNKYREMLSSELDRYQLTRLDAQELWRREFAQMPVDLLYKDQPHYSTQTEFPAALARSALKLAESARIPKDSAYKKAFLGRDLKFLAPQMAGGSAFSNRILDCTIYPLTSPLEIETKGRVLACYLISSKGGPAIDFQAENGLRGPYSAQISPRENGPLNQLKHLLLWAPLDPPLVVQDRLTIVPREMGRRKPTIQHTMAWNPSSEGDASATGGLIGILAEIDG